MSPSMIDQRARMPVLTPAVVREPGHTKPANLTGAGEHDREAVPLTVPVVSDDRQQPLAFGHRQKLGLLHPENLIQSGYPSENIIFSDLREVDRKVKPKVSAGSSGNLRKCEFPYLLL